MISYKNYYQGQKTTAIGRRLQISKMNPYDSKAWGKALTLRDDWSKINLVLGNNEMIKTEKLDKSLFPNMDEQLMKNLESRNWEVNTKLFKEDSEQDQINEINKIIGIEAQNNIKVVESAESA